MTSEKPYVSLEFPLEVEEEWPPVDVECLPFETTPEGYVALVPPLFVGDLSVGDVIEVELHPGTRRVESWKHVARSRRTTIWLLRTQSPNAIDVVLAELRALNCHTVCLDQAGAYSIDVPESLAIERVDSVLSQLDEASVAVAFPSMRHDE
jgi:hypothetical protein